MTFLIAAAGTGGHVFPGLAVGEALVEMGVARDDVIFVGGDRIEATVYPAAGFPFLGLELRGLQRSMTTRNLGLPRVMWRARDLVVTTIRQRRVKTALGMGGYVTVPTAMAARKCGISLLVAEQNAGAGLANRVASRWAKRTFTSFPGTHGLETGEWVGNPVRRALAVFDRAVLRDEGLSRYRLDPATPVLGIFGGSLGAGALNTAASDLSANWGGPPLQILHLTGTGNLPVGGSPTDAVVWRQIEFEDRMDLFYAATDLVVARSGGGVAELTATGTPSILVPGDFGSSGHQAANAEFLRTAGAAVVLSQDRIGELSDHVRGLIFDPERLASIAQAARQISKPEAAMTIAAAMLEMPE
jgi:UDP-N-acetylglucosamine--N-acetylmuramyl-(pentapeptide) pyrophosphoryl-undecaprenol N-acetylglucosamine transferase